MLSSIFILQGTSTQQQLAANILERCRFPFEELRKRFTRDYIPVEWVDLSRYSEQLAANKTLAALGGHNHIHENGDTGHPIEVRNQVLGLAWYSGKVSLEVSLESYPEIAGEVLLSEGAHMLDFFWMEDWHRMVIWNALHPEQEDLPLDTNVEDGIPLLGQEGWFDVGDYYSWVGEAWMGLFVRAYSDYRVTIEFDRFPTDEAVEQVLAAFTPYAGLLDSPVYHDTHRSIDREVLFVTPPVDRRPCAVCKPK